MRKCHYVKRGEAIRIYKRLSNIHFGLALFFWVPSIMIALEVLVTYISPAFSGVFVDLTVFTAPDAFQVGCLGIIGTLLMNSSLNLLCFSIALDKTYSYQGDKEVVKYKVPRYYLVLLN